MKPTRLLAVAAFLAVAGCAGTFEDYESRETIETQHLDHGVGTLEVVKVEHYDFVGDLRWHGFQWMVLNRSSSLLCVKVTVLNVRAGDWWFGNAITVPPSEWVKVAEIWSNPGVSASANGSEIEYFQVANAGQCY